VEYNTTLPLLSLSPFSDAHPSSPDATWDRSVSPPASDIHSPLNLCGCWTINTSLYLSYLPLPLHQHRAICIYLHLSYLSPPFRHPGLFTSSRASQNSTDKNRCTYRGSASSNGRYNCGSRHTSHPNTKVSNLIIFCCWQAMIH
jgi:hypothetical protein